MDRPLQKNEDIDDIDFTDDESELECATCGSEYPNCICWSKGKRPVWIKT